ncbi:spore germination protein [Paenibacillus glycanilyticus]|uniref:spore germination protein n=1 Tax=Paenibacillus glycanilyticus TaxID=126569 RepID=UPI003EBCA9EC
MPIDKSSEKPRKKPGSLSGRVGQAEQVLLPDFDINIERLHRFLGRGEDIVCRTLQHRFYGNTRYALLYIDGITDSSAISTILLGLLEDTHYKTGSDSGKSNSLYHHLTQQSIVFGKLFEVNTIEQAGYAMLEGSSVFSLLAPVTFFKFFQSSDDYYQRSHIATFLRIIRMVSFFITMLLPSLYIAITTFHQEMLPTPLLISLAAQREGTPFPALLEAFLMEVTFEILREAGVRMPRIIGPAISIVGALVLGQAAVQAGIISAAMVIVVSFTAIASFVIPAVNMGVAARLIRFVLMILAGTFGLFGVMSGLMILMAHLCGLRSFGKPYMMPVSPLVVSNLKDVLLRVPWWAMRKRPVIIADSSNEIRLGGSQKPRPDQEGA